jgi:serine phosphatase RsbU (regulator of sigma subunit)
MTERRGPVASSATTQTTSTPTSAPPDADPLEPEGDAPSTSRMRPIGTRSVVMLPATALLIGAIVTVALVVVSSVVYSHNEHRLLRLRVEDAAALVTSGLPDVETTLASAAELADVTHGNPARFSRLVGTAVRQRMFVSVSLWNLRRPRRGPLTVVGEPPILATRPALATAFFRHVAQSSKLDVIGLLSGPQPRIGYGYSTPGIRSGYVAYAEVALPASHHTPVAPSSSFAGLNYAIYLGRPHPAGLVITNSRPPLRGQVASARIPFGDQTFTLSMSARSPLSGALLQDLPWITALLGGVLSLLAAAGAARLALGRRRAEVLARELERSAAENRRLYSEQRTIAQTLQHALLPDVLPVRRGLETSARYEAGERSVDIGGDWYDMIERQDGSLLAVVGDVSGRGLKAATTMAALRHAIQAYGAQGDAPAEILSKLGRLISVATGGQLATIVCAELAAGDHHLTLASAGHLPPLMLTRDGRAEYLRAPVGLPVGIDTGVVYETVSLEVPAGATLIAYTDGLVEQRGEHLDQGLERLRAAATGQDCALDQLLGKLVRDLTPQGAKDDIAILGIRWTN